MIVISNKELNNRFYYPTSINKYSVNCKNVFSATTADYIQ